MHKGAIREIVFLEPKASANHIFSRIVIPRLGAPLLGTMLAQRGYNVRVIAEEVSPIDMSQVLKADLVCISTITSTAPRAYQYADAVRAAKVPVVMGGVHPTFRPDEALQHCDYVVRGEGEGALLELVRAIENGGDLASIGNLSWCDKGRNNHNDLRPLVKDLDSLPAPDFSLVQGWPDYARILPISTSRGCPYNCAFCSVVPMFGRGYRFTSIDRTMEEIRAGVKRSKHIFFVDDNFTANPDRTKQLLEQCMRENIPLDWSAQVRAEIARDTELLEIMHRANCFTVFVGFESVNPRTLKLYNKRQSLEDIRAAMANFRKYGIHVHGMFVFGADEDTAGTIHETVKFAKETGISSVQFLILTPLPGTRMYDQIEAEGRILDRDWSHYDAHHTVYLPKMMTRYELQTETFKAMRKFYSWPSFLMNVGRLDLYYAGIGLYGRRSINIAFRDKKRYIGELKDSVYARVAQLKESLGLAAKVEKVGMPAVEAGEAEEGKLKFLVSFLRNLGVNLVVDQKLKLEDTPSKVSAQLKKLQERVDLVLVPCRETLRERLKDLSIKGKAKPWLKGLPVDLRLADFYMTCLEIGLLLGRKAREVSDAYWAATDEVRAGTPA